METAITLIILYWFLSSMYGFGFMCELSEPQKWWHYLVTFIMALMFAWLVVPIVLGAYKGEEMEKDDTPEWED